MLWALGYMLQALGPMLWAWARSWLYALVSRAAVALPLGFNYYQKTCPECAINVQWNSQQNVDDLV